MASQMTGETTQNTVEISFEGKRVSLPIVRGTEDESACHQQAEAYQATLAEPAGD